MEDKYSFITPATEPSKPSPSSGASPALPPYRYEYRTRDILLAWACWLCGYLFCVAVPVTKALIFTFCFELLMFVGGTVVAARADGAKLWRSLPVSVISVLLSLSLLLTTNKTLIVCVFLFTCVSWFYMIFVLSGRSEEKYPGAHFVSEAARAVFVTPFRAPGGIFSALFGSNRRSEKTNRIGPILGWVLLGLCAAVIPTLVVGLLLSYDKGFTALLDRIFDAEQIFRQFRQIALGLLVGFLLFGALLAALTRKERAPYEGPVVHRDPGVFPLAVVCAALTPLLVLYVIFFVSQWDYYVSAFTNVLPEGLTYAGYAREGFFQLCAVAGINAGLCLLASVFTRKRAHDAGKPDRDPVHPLLKVFLCVLSLFTLVLIATALSKMFLYVDTYGLTHKRVFATWFMLLLAVCFLAVIVRQFVKKMNLVGTLVTVSAVFLLVISLVNVDTLIVRYNADACLDGNVRTMQGDVLFDAGPSGVLPALDFMEATADASDPDLLAVRDRTDLYLKDMALTLKNKAPGEHNIVTLRARKALETRGYAVND